MPRLAERPAVVATGGDDVDLLEEVLPHIRQEELVRAAAIDGEAVGMAAAVGVDLVAAGRAGGRGVRGEGDRGRSREEAFEEASSAGCTRERLAR